jgi:hypothetical protein
VHVAGRRSLKAEGNITHRAFPVFVPFDAKLAGFLVIVRRPVRLMILAD